jgi:hypothetical protein
LALHKARALRVQGDFEACVALAETCAMAMGDSAQLALLEGAACASSAIKTKEAYKLFDMATSPVFAASNYQDVAVYRFSLFARNTQYDLEVPQILSRYPGWSADELKEITAILVLINSGHAEGFSEASIQQKMQSLSAKNSEWANEMTIAWFTHLVLNKYDSIGGLKFLENTQAQVYEVDRLYKYIFRAIFSTEGENYKFVKSSLDVYYKYAGPYSWLPVEQNLYVQSQQYNQVCKNTLAQAGAADELIKIKKFWLSGGAPAEVLAKVEALDFATPGKADILTLKASVQTTLGQEDLAFANFWKAHQACNHYHRGHWGLHGLKRDRFYRSLDDYQGIRQRVAKELSETQFSSGISQYIMNWSMLTPSQADDIKHAIKIWAPFVDGLLAAGTHLYVKHDFEFHSEIPGYESDRDERVWPPDNRVADEIRGRGGNPVVTDLGETLRTPHGDYNLAAHEIAHSWHLDYLPSVGRQDLQNCITKMYEAAGGRELYADPYAASHENEYFAQAISYHLIPEGSPARYGLSGAWIKKNDPDMYEFIKRIEASKGDISKISCPI